MGTTYFERFAGFWAILAGIAAFLYALTFFVLSPGNPSTGAVVSSILLILAGLLFTPALVAIYARVRETDAAFALWALILSFFGLVGAVVHGGFDLAVAITPASAGMPALAAQPAVSQVDPRGLLTFGFVGLGIFVVSWLIQKGGMFPRTLGYWGYILAILYIITYLARLIVISPSNLVLVIPALLTGFVFAPVWFIWLGIDLQRAVVDERAAVSAHKPDLHCCSV